MNLPPRLKTLRIPAAALAALACFAPGQVWADSTVFQTDFTGNTIHDQTPPASITPTTTHWAVLSSKDGRTSSVSGSGGLNLTFASPSSAAGVEAAARFTISPIALAAVGDSITARATVYTERVLTLACGLYESGGIDPLITLNNAGLSATPLTVSTQGGSLGWKGYRARLESNNVSGNIAARAAQTGSSLTQQAHDLVAANTAEFNSPGPISIGSVPASSTPVTLADGFATEYRLTYKIVRTAADALTITYTVADNGDSVLYSVTGTTTNTGTRPSEITSSFDGFAIGNRNNATVSSNPSTLTLTALTITASNSAIARIVNQPINQTWVAGQPGSVSVNAAGTAPLSYQWYKGSDPISGATSATYSIPSVSAGDAGDYHVVVSNAFGFETSATVSASIASASAPSFTTHPATQTVNEGETLTLTAAASGAPTPTYQWYKGSNPISGATFSTYTISSTVAADAGTYHVVATNGSGSTPSNDATVTIHSEAPGIASPPSNVTVNVGQGIVLSVVATGYPAPSYQWYKGSDPISGATGSSYTVASATTADNGTYHVVATNLYGSAPSADATVTVNVVPPSITTEPSSTTVTLGQPASFTVVASGSAPLSYQWYKGTDPISGATSATYTIATTTGSSAGDYHVVVNNESGVPATSATVTLSLVVTENTDVFSTNFAGDTINPTTPAITPTATSWYILSSKNARFCFVGDDPATTEVTEARPLTVLTEAVTTSGFIETAARFASSPVSLSQIGSQVRVTAVFVPRNVLTFGFGLYNSAGAHPLQLDFDPGSTFPAEERFVLGTAGNTAANASDLPTPRGTEKWIGYRGTLGNLAGSGNVGQTLATRPVQISSTNRGQELCVTGSGSTSYGEPGGVNVSATKTPSSDAVGTLVDGATYTLVLTLSRSAADEYTFGYQIYEGTGTGGTLFRAASGTTTAVGTKPSEVTQSFDAFGIGLRNVNNTSVPQLILNSLQVTHSIPVTAVPPAISTQPSSVTVNVGDPFTLTGAATGSPTPTYQWYKGVDPVPGATSASYHVDAAASGDAGSYTLVATNAVGSATSNAVTVTVGSATPPYDTWASSYGLNPSTTGAPTANPTGDGVTNLVKFVLGGDPTVANSTTLPVLAKSGANVTFTYDLKVVATEQFSVGAEYTTDLATTWTPAVHGTGGVTISTTELDPATDRIVVTVPFSGAKIFVRLRIQDLP